MSTQTPDPYDVIVVGAGFAGLYALHALRERGFRVIVLERGDGVGGTWFWNRYPGARCDVESMYYSYSFSTELEQEWTWSEKYATQPEILAYLEHVADRFDLRPDIRLRSDVVSADFESQDSTWTVRTGDGQAFVAPYLVMATGNLSNGRTPALPGLASFEGTVIHTGDWPHEGHDFAGQRVAVIGTGSSGIQAIPEIAREADHVVVLQRTPSFSIPARNAPLSPEVIADVKSRYPEIRETARWASTGSPYPPPELKALDSHPAEREKRYEDLWSMGGPRIMGAYADLLVRQEANDTLAEFVRSKIDDMVDDPDTATRLKPHGYPLGAKRVCVDTDYYRTYNRSNVELIDLRDSPIDEVTTTGISVAGRLVEVDVIVFATGYDAMTGALTRMDLRGADGQLLRTAWEDGAGAYLGVAVAGFPNMFLITGPGSPSVIGNVVVAIEQHVEWIAEHLTHLRQRGLTRSEARDGAVRDWMDHVEKVASATLFPTANSWYLGANIPGKPRRFLPYIGGGGAFRRMCDEVAGDNYRGFDLA
jgi:cation diffusion facilitator CzcD-associated flavoprotein CzcO